jgi:pentatricopeptide repeat protein
VYCINSLMGVHLAQGRYQRVQELYAAMQSSGVVPDMCSTNTAIAACEKLGDGPAALALLRLVLCVVRLCFKALIMDSSMIFQYCYHSL